MYRHKINELIKWKLNDNRKPLIILGARQVGKTWLIQEFGKQEYKQTVYINFEKMKFVSNLFEEDFDIQRILSSLSIFARTAINPDDTLIVFDVIQQLLLNDDNDIYYWINENGTAEVDFVIQNEEEIIPIEVKSGTNVKSRSFKLFCEKYKPSKAIRTSLTDYKQEKWMINLPLYAINSI